MRSQTGEIEGLFWGLIDIADSSMAEIMAIRKALKVFFKSGKFSMLQINNGNGFSGDWVSILL